MYGTFRGQIVQTHLDIIIYHLHTHEPPAPVSHTWKAMRLEVLSQATFMAVLGHVQPINCGSDQPDKVYSKITYMKRAL